ncbi:MAG: tetratricopeptide repeat protein [Planctomycetes bacterium]|nr:tetratricopeptide repeat protein [Planctomycetota bacterium]
MTRNTRHRMLLYPAAVLILAALGYAGFLYRAEPEVPQLVNSAEVLAQAGVFERAIEDAERALRQDPDHPYAHVILGYAYGQTGSHGKSVHHYRRAVELTPAAEPTLSALRLYLAEALLAGGNPADCVREAEAVLAEWPREYQANYVLGRAFLAMGRPADARAAFEAARAAAPGDPEPLLLLAGLAESAGDLREAERVLGEAVDVSAGSAEALLRRAMVREARADHEGAVLDTLAAAKKSRAYTSRSLARNDSLSKLREDPRVVAALAAPKAPEKKSGNG